MKWLAIMSFSLSCTVSAHSLSTAFMQLKPTDTGLSATLELSINDLQQVLNWPAEQDVRWSDIQKNKLQILSYLEQHLQFNSAAKTHCELQTDPTTWSAIEKNHTYYLSLPLFSTCNAQQSSLRYQIFNELHDHKLIVSWSNQQKVVTQQNPVLDLTQMAP